MTKTQMAEALAFSPLHYRQLMRYTKAELQDDFDIATAAPENRAAVKAAVAARRAARRAATPRPTVHPDRLRLARRIAR